MKPHISGRSALNLSLLWIYLVRTLPAKRPKSMSELNIAAWNCRFFFSRLYLCWRFCFGIPRIFIAFMHFPFRFIFFPLSLSSLQHFNRYFFLRCTLNKVSNEARKMVMTYTFCVCGELKYVIMGIQSKPNGAFFNNKICKHIFISN